MHWITRTAVALGLSCFGWVQLGPVLAGSLVLVGGNWAFPGSGGAEEDYGVSIYDEIVDLAGGLANAKIGIISTASSTPERSAGSYIADFQALYGDSVDVEWIPVTVSDCAGYKNDSNSAIASQISSRNAFVFTGGDQSLITECFFNENVATQSRTDTALIQSLREQFAKGAVIAGTSAGTAVQPSTEMITNGESYEALRDGSNSLIGSPPFDNTLYYNPLGGLGFFDYGILDSHFSERGRQGRIIRLASDLGIDTAFGVDENTALVVTDTNTDDVDFKVLGQNGVFIADLTGSEPGSKAGNWTIEGVKATYLTEGDTYDPLTKTATFGGKTSLKGSEVPSEIPNTENVFSFFDADLDDWTNQRAFTNTAIALFGSTSDTAAGTSLESDPTYGVTLTKGLDAEGFAGVDGLGATRVSFKDLDVAIAPTPEPSSLLGLISIGTLGIVVRLRRQRED